MTTRKVYHGDSICSTTYVLLLPSLPSRDLINTLEPQTNAIVTALTAVFMLYTRSAGVAFFIVGAVLCSLIVKTLKRCFRQPRPVVVNGRKKKTYG